VRDFIAGVENAGRREDAEILLKVFERATGWPAQMWGPTIIGFGRHIYSYDSGHSGEMLVVGFSPRKANMVFYVNRTSPEAKALLAKLGKVKMGVGCTYLGRLTLIDLGVLEAFIKEGVAATRQNHKVFPK
jgi:hypothetical protein